MATKAGEIFVEIFVKGGQEAGKALAGVKDFLGDVSTKGLAAKAAIVGALYAVEQFAQKSIELGTSFHQFSVYTGLSSQMLQQWQHAMQKSGISAEETEGSIINIQKSMGQWATFNKEPAGLKQLQFTLGQVGETLDRSKIGDMNYVLEKLRKYAQLEKRPFIRNQVLESMGATSGFTTGLAEYKGNVSQEPIQMTKKMEDQLFKVGQQFREFMFLWQKFRNELTAKYGIPVIEELREAIKGAQWIMKLTDQFKILKVILAGVAVVLAVMFGPVTAAVAAVTALITLLAEVQKYREGKGFFGMKNPVEDIKKGVISGGSGALGRILSGSSSVGGEALKGLSSFFTSPAPQPVNSNVVNKNSTVNYTAHNYGNINPEEHENIVRRGMQSAVRQIIGTPVR